MATPGGLGLSVKKYAITEELRVSDLKTVLKK